jgi:mRNA interferase MazF
MTYSAFDVVVVPFPFTDRGHRKRRPALVVSQSRAFNDPSGHCVLAMVTSAGHRPWPLDVEIGDLDAPNLPVPSLVRMKLFTLDDRLVLRRLGKLARADVERVKVSLRRLLPVS